MLILSNIWLVMLDYTIVNVITILALPESHHSNDNRHSMSK